MHLGYSVTTLRRQMFARIPLLLHDGAASILVNAVLRYLALPRHEKSGTPRDGAGEDGISAEDVDANTAVLKKIESIKRILFLYHCETGVTPLYFAFPLLMLRERDVGTGKGALHSRTDIYLIWGLYAAPTARLAANHW
jgi:hypothetical protein